MEFEHNGTETKMVGGCGVIEHVRKGLICKALQDTVNLNSEIILSEITINNNKWAIFSACRPPCNSNIEVFFR